MGASPIRMLIETDLDGIEGSSRAFVLIQMPTGETNRMLTMAAR
jgi:hypothetical protein